MNNIVLVTSIIDTPNLPFSYINNRSVFTIENRIEQTKKTIQTIKEKIPNLKIILIECSKLTKEQNNYFLENCDYFINLIEDKQMVDNIYSNSKALGEGTMTIAAIKFINNNNINFDNFIKISGRYWLSDNFNYSNINNNNIVVHYINNDPNNVSTALYKINKKYVNNFYNFLNLNINQMKNCIGYEVLFAQFLNSDKNHTITNLNKIGVNGYVSVSNDFVDN
jgi:hypothetical protein